MDTKPVWFLQPKSSCFFFGSSILKHYSILHHCHATTFHATTCNSTTSSHLFHDSWHVRRDNAFSKTNKKNKESKHKKQTIFLCTKTRSTYWKSKHQTWIRNIIWKSQFFSTHNIFLIKDIIFLYRPCFTSFSCLAYSSISICIWGSTS